MRRPTFHLRADPAPATRSDSEQSVSEQSVAEQSAASDSLFLAPAQKPPPGLIGLDPSWSRLVRVDQTDDIGRTWHLLDSFAERPTDVPRLTLLCVHGNPSWSFLWRRIVAAAPEDVRVIAVDQLEMGFSERSGRVRRLATRIQDLSELTDHIGITGPGVAPPVVTVAHDWGGPISLGWAERHSDQVQGVVLLNTAVHQPVGSPAPAIIRTIRAPGVLRRITVSTTTFIAGAVEMSRPRLEKAIREGFYAPYVGADRRHAIADFVADIPLDPSHPSASTLDAVAEGLTVFSETPALLLWGPKDKVFSDLYLHDFEERLPHADVHRFRDASHFVSEDANITGPLFDWLDHRVFPSLSSRPGRQERVLHDPVQRPSLFSGLSLVEDPTQTAVIEVGDSGKAIQFGDLERRITAAAAGLRSSGVGAGDRVALMVPPSIDLTIALYACWRAGAVAVLVDAGLGPTGMLHALGSAAPNHLIGIQRALVFTKALRLQGQRFSTTPLRAPQRLALSVSGDLGTLSESTASVPDTPEDDADAAVVFTSGSTGPSKGVCYTHRQLQAQRDILAKTYEIGPQDRLVAAFAPFALYGPALGILSVVPTMDVAAPGTLTAEALGDAVVAAAATMVFASPAALVNVLETANGLSDVHEAAFARVRVVLSAGAPLRTSLLEQVDALFPNATTRTPYGMTEVLPTSSISLPDILEAESEQTPLGVCVGHPVTGTSVSIDALDAKGRPRGHLSVEPGSVGEILIQSPHASDRYDRLWHTNHLSSQPSGWHRSGDVGALDSDGRLWVGGRLGHVITTSTGPVTPVGLEQAIETIADVSLAAVVGVGPVGAQQVVAVVEIEGASRRSPLADLSLHDAVRHAVQKLDAPPQLNEGTAPQLDVAAVLVTSKLPVDRRHNSKIDRTRIAQWAFEVLAGGRPRRI